ncbi:type VI secretion system tip protein VgrG [Escherichia coli]|nr:type VI secretion system tip protein VgrG [Escherichia coli]EFM6074293.1 type VI secretion system tip protein VgrG [Escherichia coli]EIQ0727058.1 type VI secretion system tip protein VgrG [Escherichia coli]WFV56336.1 type VI secretion system tip protein VgrG [Escherichia coli]
MSFVSTGNKSAGSHGPEITTPPIAGESGGMSAGSAATGVADAAEQMAEQAAADLFGALPEPSGLVKAAVAAAQAAAAVAGISDITGAAQDAAVSLAAGGPGAHNVTVSGSAVPPQMLLFASINGSEKLGSLFTYIVQLKTPDTLNLGYVSPAANLPLKPMVGKDLCVNIELDGGGKRYISGLVTAARVVGHEGRSVTYELRIEPWLKLLTHSSDYKAFQNKTVVDILDEVLADYDFPVEKRLVENYPIRTWQVQYSETDFDFIQRLMQEWGIYWWFEHSENSHTLVLADAISAHKACPDSPLVEWHQEGLKLDKEFIHTKGPQSAIVTGPAGQEIWTDKYGRVKVQFGWDRYGKNDENSSCWIRVSYPWAGKGFGMIQIPRIGQEVLVDFKNGDPDLPIIVGRTYNQDTMPPWGLPGMASQSGIFSHSLYGGPTNGNMLRFDDKTGAEEVRFLAEKDLNTVVKNNETHTVKADRTKTIIYNETSTVKIDRTEFVDGKHTETIKGDRDITVTEGKQSLTVKTGNREIKVETGICTETVEGDITITSKTGAIHLTAATQIKLTVGKSTLVMNSDGTITLDGPTHLALNPQ